MKDYLIRMGEELNQLKERLDKLTKFIDNNEIFFNLTVEKGLCFIDNNLQWKTIIIF